MSSGPVSVPSMSGAATTIPELLAAWGLHTVQVADPLAPQMIVALMIGELKYQPKLNAITSAIVETAVKAWRSFPSATLVCEAEPMARLASAFGVFGTQLHTAVPAARGHTTRKLAEWLRARPVLPGRSALWVITHSLHADRARRIMERCGVHATCLELNTPFLPADADWKLRSALHFRLYNIAAEVYCRCRGWL